jgi:PIN domain nuclease of toxin-antitoxin system
MSDAVTDTHALIWYLEDSPNLGTAANEIFKRCDRGEISIYIPTICLVEMVYLQEKGRISPNLKMQLDTELRTSTTGFILANLTDEVAEAVAKVSRTTVPDLPDRIITATSLHLGLPLISRDSKIRLAGISLIW